MDKNEYKRPYLVLKSGCAIPIFGFDHHQADHNWYQADGSDHQG